MSLREPPERANPSRRDFVALGIGAIVVAGLPVAVRRRRQLVRRSLPVMGTIADIAVVHRDPQYAHRAIDAALAELRWVDETMTRFNAGSEVGRANLEALTRAVAISTETALVLAEALRWAQASDGSFDPCLGRALELWDVGQRRIPPSAAEVGGLAGPQLYRQLELAPATDEPTVRFHDPRVAIDLGGIAKGYGVDRAVEALRSFGIYNGLVNVGGDLYALGRSEDGDAWKVGIRDPEEPDRLIESIEASDCAVATSGDYLQYFQYGGQRYHHMLDPLTGEPRIAEMRSVTIKAETCMAADAAGTAAFGMPAAEAMRVLQAAEPGARVVHSV
jgi:thiamine biosynthesis lipoprotein